MDWFVILLVFFLMIPRRRISIRTDTLSPHTTLFGSLYPGVAVVGQRHPRLERQQQFAAVEYLAQRSGDRRALADIDIHALGVTHERAAADRLGQIGRAHV